MNDNKTIKTLLVVILIVLVLNTTLLIVFNGSSSKEETTSNYDVSMFTKASMTEVLGYFGKNEKVVVYMGKESCQWCIQFLPHMKEAQEKYGYTTVYLDVTTISKTASNYSDFLAKLSIKDFTLDPNDGQGERTKSFGAWYDEFGFTPMFFIIEDGKFKDGLIGYYDYAGLETFLEENGFSSK